MIGRGREALAVADKVLEPLEELGMAAQEGGRQLDELRSAHHLLVEEDQAAEEVVVDFLVAQSLPDFVKEGELVQRAEFSGLGERHVAQNARLLLLRRRIRHSTRRPLDDGAGRADVGAQVAARKRTRACGSELEATAGERRLLRGSVFTLKA